MATYTLEDIEDFVKAKAAIPMMLACPGSGKTAIAYEIAKKNDWALIDLRLAQMDQSEVSGLYDRQCDEKGNKNAFLLPQKWAVSANHQPTLVFFDELNRASREVRNAALQIFSERRLGDVRFNDDVYFLAAGNLGDEDNTDIECFDDADNNRMIFLKIEVNSKDWINQWLAWAETNSVIKPVISYIKNTPHHLFAKANKKDSNENEAAFATARSWTNFSKFISFKGVDVNSDDFITVVDKVLPLYVGGSVALNFHKFLDTNRIIKVDDILNHWTKKTKDIVPTLSRDKISELIHDLAEKNINDMNTKTPKQLDNVIEFLKMCDVDEVVGFIQGIVDSGYSADSDNAGMIKVYKEFKPILKKIEEASYAELNAGKEEESEDK